MSTIEGAMHHEINEEKAQNEAALHLALRPVQQVREYSAAPSRQLIVVSCYTRFDNLAHGPRGSEARRALHTYWMDQRSGEMMLLSVTKEDVMNPAFSRFHPKKNIVYTCTESVAESGEIDAWEVEPRTGKLSRFSNCSAGGTSTCYLTLDRECKNMLAVNYWNATIGVFGVDKSGRVTGLRSMYDPNNGRPMRARHDKHVNHSHNDESAQKERQSDPHSHAVILDPYVGRIAYVPDLGMDLIRQFRYDPERGTLAAAGTFKSGPDGRVALGPRYIEFHPTLPVCYVVNELSSEVSVFEFDRQAADQLVNGSEEAAHNAQPTLRLIETVRTIPDGFPGDMNTCGRICVHSSGNFVLVSNRGHDSITVFRVHHEMENQGSLSVAAVQHTQGKTPRHFQFDGSGQWLISANQDSDNITVFRFNVSTGKLEFSGNQYEVPSPNFVCSVVPHSVLAPTAARRKVSAGRKAARANGLLAPVLPAPVSRL